MQRAKIRLQSIFDAQPMYAEGFPAVVGYKLPLYSREVHEGRGSCKYFLKMGRAVASVSEKRKLPIFSSDRPVVSLHRWFVQRGVAAISDDLPRCGRKRWIDAAKIVLWATPGTPKGTIR